MAISTTITGKGITTEKYVVQATSTNLNITSMLCELIIDGFSTFAEVEQDPNINNSLQFDFELADMLKDLYEFQFRDLTAATSFSTQIVYVRVRLEEIEGTVLTGVFNDSFYRLKNITQGVFEIEEFDLLDYHVGTTGDSTKKFLTSSPLIKNLAEGDSEFLTASSWDFNAQQWVVESYDINNVLIGTVNEPLTDQNSVPGFPGFGLFSYSDNNAIRLTSDSGTAYKLVYVADIAGGAVRSETRRFDNSNSCGGVRLHWLNEFGEQDSFTFDGKITKSLLTSFDSFKRIRPVDPSSTDVGDLVYKSEYGQEWAIFTRVVPPSFIEWLSKSMVNNRAAIEVNGKYFPVIIKDKKKVTSDNLSPVFQFALSFMFANKRKGVQ